MEDTLLFLFIPSLLHVMHEYVSFAKENGRYNELVSFIS